MLGATLRSRRAPTLWKVPHHASRGACWRVPRPSASCRTRPTRRSISAAARREKVSRSSRDGSAPARTRRATRAASVSVLPEPAPATTSSGPIAAPAAPSRPKPAARRCASFSPARSEPRGAARATTVSVMGRAGGLSRGRQRRTVNPSSLGEANPAQARGRPRFTSRRRCRRPDMSLVHRAAESGSAALAEAEPSSFAVEAPPERARRAGRAGRRASRTTRSRASSPPNGWSSWSVLPCSPR